MADEKDTEASRLALEKFIPELNRLSGEGFTGDDYARAEIRRRQFCDRYPGNTKAPIRRLRIQQILPNNKEFGRDTNRLDYFPVTPLEVSYDSKYDESDYYGGGSSHSGQQQSVSTIFLDTDDFDTSDINVLPEENIPNNVQGDLQSSEGGQQQSVPTIYFDTSDVLLDDGTGTQEENIPNIGLGTTENVHAENTDIGQDKYTKLVHYFDTTELSNCIIWFGIFGFIFWFYGLI